MLVFTMEDIPLLFMLIAVTGVVFSKSLVQSVVFLSFFSMMLTLKFFLLHAPDVALTEAALGAGLTTLVFAAAIYKTRHTSRKEHNS
ncbi:MAG: Na(+)/H(+) antiporter subunit B [Spirochaeta sp.]